VHKENWVPIDGYLGRYAVSDQGNVMSMNYQKSGMPGLLKFNKARGYNTVELQTGPIKKRFTVHRLVAAAFIGTRPDGQHLNHKDGVKTNNAINNLEYVTPSENQKHSFRLGLQSNVGELHSRHILTESDVIAIRARHAAGESENGLARAFAVSYSTIYKVVRGLRWGHIPFAGEVRVVQ
jgi:hypothetical protein